MAADPEARRRPRWWTLGLTAVALVADVTIGQLAGWADSGAHDPPGQIAVFWVFVLAVLTMAVNALLLLVAWWRHRTPKPT